MITYFLCDNTQNPLNGDREFRGPIMSNRHGAVGQNCPPDMSIQHQHHQQQQQATSLQSSHHQQPVEFYQKHSEISEKNYHQPNVISGVVGMGPDNYAKKESYNFVASPNLLQQHPVHAGGGAGDENNYGANKPNFSSHDHQNIYNKKRDHYAAVAAPLGMPPQPPLSHHQQHQHQHHQHQQNYHRENFNITENPNLLNSRENYNIRENYTSIENCNMQPPSRTGAGGRLSSGSDPMRNHLGNSYVIRENEPLLHQTPVAKVMPRPQNPAKYEPPRYASPSPNVLLQQQLHTQRNASQPFIKTYMKPLPKLPHESGKLLNVPSRSH